eukprot:TRINITY_DN2889_c0_g1_i5.p1 TRINITY_DN2889_c0_g1~~TRINITY_DN2889_c0_g1_i5.p1  ORF type:complete len:2604 (+),score=718.86 TRINITY_DN2889_c0_g1_i5:258-8069(+)
MADDRGVSVKKRRGSVMPTTVSATDVLQYSIGGLCRGFDDSRSGMYTIEDAIEVVRSEPKLLGFTYRGGKTPRGEVMCYFKRHGAGPNTDPEWSRYTREDFFGEWSCSDLFHGKGGYEHRSHHIQIYQEGLIAIHNDAHRSIIWRTSFVPPVGSSAEGVLQGPPNEAGEATWLPCTITAINNNNLQVTIPSTKVTCNFRREYRPPLSRYKTHEIKRSMCQKVLGSTRRSLNGEESEYPYNVTDDVLYCIHPRSSFRISLVRIIDNVWFDRAVLLLIILNAFALVLDDPLFNNIAWLQELTRVSEITFQVLFSIEMVLKILALGFVMHPGSYLRSDPVPFWNRLDFLIILSGYAALAAGSGNFTVLRLLRCLRPLRTMNRVKELRQLMATLASALPLAIDIFLLFFLLMWVFAILGIQLFAGDFHRRCYIDPPWDGSINTSYFESLPPDGETTYNLTPGYNDRPWLVYNDTDTCGSGRHCTLNGLDVPQSCLIIEDFYQRKVLIFDNIYTSLLFTFKLMSLDDWPDNMKDIQDAHGHYAWIYFFFLTLLGNVFAVNLILAMLSSVYSHERENKVVTAKPVLERLTPATFIAAAVAHPLLVVAIPIIVEEAATEEEDIELDVDDPYEGDEWIKSPELKASEASLGPMSGGKLEGDLPGSSLQSTGDGDDTLNSSEGSAAGTSDLDTEIYSPRYGMEKKLGRKVVPADTLSRSLQTDTSYAAGDRLDVSMLQTSIDDLDALQDVDEALQTLSNAVVHEDAPVDLPGSPGERKLQLKRDRIHRLRKIGYYKKGTVGNWLFRMSRHRAFNILVITVTMINIIALAMDHYTINSGWLNAINWINYVSTFVFLSEASIKIVGMTPELYFSDNYNTFDFLLVLVSIPEITTHTPPGGGSGLSALRGFRLARIFRLAKKWHGLNFVLKQISNAVIDVGYLSIIMFVFLFIYTIMGVQLFSCSNEDEGYEGRCGFENLGASALTVFVVLTGENWGLIMKSTIMRSSAGAAVYFVSLFTLGNYILLNLLIAILIDNFTGQEEGDDSPWECCKPKVVKEASIVIEQSEDLTHKPVHPHEPIAENLTEGLPRGKSEDELVYETPRLPNLEIESATEEESRCNVIRPSRSSLSLAVHPLEDQDALKYPDTVATPADITLPFADQNGYLTDARRNSIDDKNMFVSMQMGAAGSSFCTKKRRERRLSVWSMSGHTKASVQVHKKAKTIAGRSSLFPPGEEHGKIVEIPHQPFEKLRFAEFNRRVDTVDSILQKFSSPTSRPNDEDCCLPPLYIRDLAYKIVTWTYFDLAVLGIIVLNLIFISIDNPSVEDNHPQVYDVLRMGDFVFVSLFSLEMMTKILAWGWVGFFSDKWNAIDAIVVVTSLIGLFVPMLRSFRSLRILRLVTSGSPEMKIVLTAVMSAMPSIQNVIFVSTMVWFIFAIVGVSLFKGALYECNDPDVTSEAECVGNYSMQVQDAFGVTYVESERFWGPIWFTFDDVFESMFTLFQISVGERWREMMYRTVDAPGPGEGPRHNSNIWGAVFFVAFTVLGEFFFVNLFIGVLIQAFAITKEKTGKNHLLMTEAQRNWQQAQRVLLHSSIREGYYPLPPFVQKSWFLSWVHYIACGKKFEATTTALIILNSITLALQHQGQSNDMTNFLFIANWFFVIAFTIEATFKILAFGGYYFKEGWNRFDFLIVVVSLGAAMSSTASTSGIRVLRVARMLRLLGRAEGLKTIVATMMSALPSLCNIAILLFVVFFVFGVFGVDLFGRIPINDSFNRWSNFDNLYKALVTLYQVSTDEGWNTILAGVTYNAPGCVNDCGVSRGVARAYFVLFLLLGSFIFLNLFVYVLIEHFEDEKRARGLQETTRDLEAFEILKREWMKEDPGGTGIASADALIRILQRLPEPLWLSSPFSMSALMGMGRTSDFLCTQKQLRSMLIPLDKSMRVRYVDVVTTLSLKVFGIDINQAITSLASDEKFDPSYWSIHHYHAVQYVIHKWMMLKMEHNYVAYEHNRCAIRKAIRLIRQRITEATSERERLATAKETWVSDIVSTYTKPIDKTNNSMNNTFLDSDEDTLDRLDVNGSVGLSASLKILDATELESRKTIFKHSVPTSITLVLPTGCYSGETKNGKPHGTGLLVYPNADGYYEGTWSGGLRHGPGVEVRAGFACKGEWLNGKLHGHAAYGYADEGWVFKGAFVNGLPKGQGKLFYFEGTKVEGEFNSSFCPTGVVEVMGPDGIHHQAPIENYGKSKREAYIFLEGARNHEGRPTGLIKCMTCNGNIYEIETVEGRLSGKGKAVINSLTPTETWEGEFLDGVLVEGTRSVDGSSITEEGLFTNNVRKLIEGTMSLPEAKVKLTGTYLWSEAGPTLQGPECKAVIFTDATLKTEQIQWSGEFKEWMLNGQGIKDYISGSTLMGQFKDGELSGFSMIKYKSGVICHGHFVNTTAHGWAKVTFPNLPEYSEKKEDEGAHSGTVKITIDTLQLPEPSLITQKNEKFTLKTTRYHLKYLETVGKPAPYESFHAPPPEITTPEPCGFKRPPCNPLIGVFHKGLLWSGPTVNGNVPHGYGHAYLQSGMYFEGIAYAGRIQAGALYTPDNEKLEGVLKFGCLLQHKDGSEARLF